MFIYPHLSSKLLFIQPELNKIGVQRTRSRFRATSSSTFSSAGAFAIS